jgi:hypothetical protein
MMRVGTWAKRRNSSNPDLRFTVQPTRSGFWLHLSGLLSGRHRGLLQFLFWSLHANDANKPADGVGIGNKQLRRRFSCSCS